METGVLSLLEELRLYHNVGFVIYAGYNNWHTDSNGTPYDGECINYMVTMNGYETIYNVCYL
jgi:hypothetical protein